MKKRTLLLVISFLFIVVLIVFGRELLIKSPVPLKTALHQAEENRNELDKVLR